MEEVFSMTSLTGILVCVSDMVFVLEKMCDTINNCIMYKEKTDHINDYSNFINDKNLIVKAIQFIKEYNKISHMDVRIGFVVSMYNMIQQIPNNISYLSTIEKEQYKKLYVKLMNIVNLEPDVKDNYWKLTKESIMVHVTNELNIIRYLIFINGRAMGSKKYKEWAVSYDANATIDDYTKLPKNYEDSDDDFTKLTKNREYLEGILKYILSMDMKIKSIYSVMMLYNAILQIPDRILSLPDKQDAVFQYQDIVFEQGVVVQCQDVVTKRDQIDITNQYLKS